MSKSFTVEQANRMLPLVSRIVADIVREYERWQERVREFELASSGDVLLSSERAEALQRAVQESALEIDSFLAELRQLGVEFRGFDLGLVDFPGEIDGRPVCLCWHLGEPEIRYWHEPDAGFAGRRPLEAVTV